MPPSRSTPARRVSLEPLTQDTFSSFGTVIENPVRSSPDADGAGTTTSDSLPPNVVFANQGSAMKVLDVTKTTDYYDEAPSRKPAKAVMNMFICAPRKLRSKESSVHQAAVSYHYALKASSKESDHVFDIKILERHPFTFQTFIPMGLDHADQSTCYLVVVAPTLPVNAHHAGPSTSGSFLDRAKASLMRRDVTQTSSDTPCPSSGTKGSGPPDLDNIRAFLARGDQAVTYAAGTWHAPMVALGLKSIDFVVVQFANGVAQEDCQEMTIVPEQGATEGLTVMINASPRGERSALEAKL
jgi:ureidoglycolate lyase